MSKWMLYKRKGQIELRPYQPGENLDKISVSPEDEPKEGDMVARNPNNHSDQWLVNSDYFKKNYEVVV